jgi:hypothetical protein
MKLTSYLHVMILASTQGLLTYYLLTYSTEQSPSSEANRFSATQEIPRNQILFYGEELLAPRPTLKLEDHPLSAVRD